jgi:hydroxymethylpyrimidine/phosphomethylpyrimidine kinase
VAADLRAFSRAGAFGCAAIAVITVQSTAGLRAAHPVGSRQLLAQLREVAEYQRVGAIKIGALGSRDNVLAVTRWLSSFSPGARAPVVLDPVMLPTRGGARLLAAHALDAMRALVAEASLVTANAGEAAALVGERVTTVSEARAAALGLCAMGARAALVKGGHLRGQEATDVLVLGGPRPRVHVLGATRLRLPPLHGGGCVLASLIAGRLAVDTRYAAAPMPSVLRAVRWARIVHRRALSRAADVGGPMAVLVP